MEDKLYAVMVRKCGELRYSWVGSDFDLYHNKENITFTTNDRYAKLYNSKNRAIDIAKTVKDLVSDEFIITVEEVEELYMLKPIQTEYMYGRKDW